MYTGVNYLSCQFTLNGNGFNDNERKETRRFFQSVVGGKLEFYGDKRVSFNHSLELGIGIPSVNDYKAYLPRKNEIINYEVKENFFSFQYTQEIDVFLVGHQKSKFAMVASTSFIYRFLSLKSKLLSLANTGSGLITEAAWHNNLVGPLSYSSRKKKYNGTLGIGAKMHYLLSKKIFIYGGITPSYVLLSDGGIEEIKNNASVSLITGLRFLLI